VVVNSTESYDFAGNGAITTGKLIKMGTGWLTLENNNTYSGPTVISNGLVQVGGNTEGGSMGSLGTGAVTNNGALVFDLNTSYTLATNIYGTGAITNIGGSGTVTLAGNVQGSTMNMAGSGDFVLSGTNTYTGQTIVYSGVLHPRTPFALGTNTALVVVSNGAQVYLDTGVNLGVGTNKPLQLAGTGPSGNGALRKGGNSVSYVGGLITLLADSQFQVDGGSSLYLTNAAGITAPGTNLTLGADANGYGQITGPLTLGAAALTSQDAGLWAIAGTNNYTGGTMLNGGTLAITAPTALGSTPSLNAAFVTFNGGTLQVSNSMTFADGLRGFTVSGTGDIDVSSGATLVIANPITGSGTLTKSDSGTLVLSAANSFNGTFYPDSNNNVNNDGVVEVTSSAALANVAGPIALRNTLGGASTFELNGAGGSITITQEFTMNGRSPKVPQILNAAGTNYLTSSITNGGNGNYVIESDSGLLTLGSAGTVLTCSGADPETITLQGNGAMAILDDIEDGTNGGDVMLSLAVNGNVTLAAVNSYSGTTAVSGGDLMVNGTIGTGAVTVSGGTLGGTGTIGGPVSVGAGGTFAPGAPTGTLTINNTLSLAGNTMVALNGGANSAVAGLTSVTYAGTLTVTNLGGTLSANQTFPLFSAGSSSGNFTSIVGSPGAGLGYSFNSTSGVLSVVSTGPGTFSNHTGITSFSLPGNGNVVITATNGQAGDAYYLLMSTSLNRPINQWTPVATNVLSASGNYTFIGTNVVVHGDSQQYFILSNTNN
jgi:autotransporter-associated beta strand protein